MMMNMDEAIGDIVLLVLRDGLPLKGLGIRQKKIYVRVKGYDRIGLWFELTDYQLPQLTDSPEGPEREMTAVGCALAPWAVIESIVHFPDLEGFDFPLPEVDSLGFQAR
tara:strand:- start:508 stop:834 length:327 start_codon:yes stop_codon:yes gene_type:complete